MPQAAAAWVGNVMLAAGYSFTAVTVAAYATYGFAVIGVNMALSALSSALLGKPRGLSNQFDRDIVVKSTTAAREFVYGEVTKGGVLAFIGTTGDANRYLDFVIVLAGHQVEAIEDVWFDDIKIPNADINSGSASGGAVTGTSTKYEPRDGNPVAWIYKYLGTSAQDASTVLQQSGDDGYAAWTTDHRLRGCAYVHIRLQRNTSAYEQGAPQNFRFHVKGARCYDPRLDSTQPGGSGTHRVDDATTWEYTGNIALFVADYITGGTITNTVVTPRRSRGFGASPDYVDWSTVMTAANVCEELVAIPPAASPQFAHGRYLGGTVVAPSDDQPDADCIETLYTGMLGNVIYTNGVYRVYAGAYQTPVYTLTEADLAGTVQYTTSTPRSDRFNYVRGTYVDLTTGQELEFVPKTDTSYQTADGRQLFHEIQLPVTENAYRAQRIAQVILRRSREQKTIVWPGQLSCAKVAVWETVQVTVGELGLSNKVFRCIRKSFAPASEGDAPIVELTLREENSTTYADPAIADYGDITIATDPGPTPDELDAPTDLAYSSLEGAIEFRWTPGASPIPLGVRFELWEHTASTPFSSAVKLWIGTASSVVIDKADNVTRYYWVRAVRGSATSTTAPAVTGLAAQAIGSDSTPPSQFIVDPEFTAGSLQYWLNNLAAYSATGGITGGYVRLSPNGVNGCYIQSFNGTQMLRLLGDWAIAATVRYRVVSELSGAHIRIRIRSVAYYPGAAFTSGEDIKYVDVSGAVIDTWYTVTVLLSYSRDGTEVEGDGEMPCPALRVELSTSDLSDGDIDIDYANGDIVAIFARTQAEKDAGVFPVDYSKPSGDILRYASLADWSASADGSVWLEVGHTYVTTGLVFAKSGIRVYGNGSTIQYDPASTSDYTVKVTGSANHFDSLYVDSNKSALAGTNGSEHPYDGWGMWVTGGGNYFLLCQSNNTPDNEAFTDSAPYGFVNNGPNNTWQSCTADDQGYSGFINLDVGAGNTATYRDCAATNARRGWTSNGDSGAILVDNFRFTKKVGGTSELAINCEIGQTAGVESFTLDHSHIVEDCTATIVKVVSAKKVHINSHCENTNTANNGSAVYIQTDAASGTDYEDVVLEGFYKTADTSSGGSALPLRIDEPQQRVRVAATLEAAAADWCVFLEDGFNTCDIVFDGADFRGAPAAGVIRVPASGSGTRNIAVIGGGDNITTSVELFATVSAPKVGELKVSGFHPRNVTALASDATASSRVQIGGGPITNRHFSGTGAPTTGTWKAGDIVFDSTGATHGWKCSASGTPGTWGAL